MLKKVKKVWKKTVAVLGVITAIWILVPLPEISILVGLVGGGSVTHYLGLPDWTFWISTPAGVILGYIIFHKLGLFDKIKEKIET